jgi:oligoendopeptidase F
MTADIQKLQRNFLPENLTVSNWETVEPYFKNLLERKINSKEEMEKWLKDMSEL